MIEKKIENDFGIDLKIVNKFLDFLLIENEKKNLISAINKEEIFEKHVYDSLIITKVYDFNNKEILDAGSGNGFPGILLAILFPNSRITLVDSVNKKIVFLKSVVKLLKLNNVVIIHKRVEEINNNIKYDVVISRALAKLRIFLELVVNLVKVNGQIIALKGKNFEKELKDSTTTIKKLKLSLSFCQKSILPASKNERINLIFNKKDETFFHRSFASIKKKSL